MKYLIVLIAAFSLILFSCGTDETVPMEAEVIEVTDDTTEDTDTDTTDTDTEEEEQSADVPKLPISYTITGSNSAAVSFTYTENNLVNEITIIDGEDDRVLRFFYDGTIVDEIREFTLDDDFTGNIQDYIIENGVIVELRDYYNETTLDETFLYSYNTNQEIISIEYIGANSSEVSEKISFTYTNEGNVASRTEEYFSFPQDNQTITYTYDNQNSPFRNFEPRIFFASEFYNSFNNKTSETYLDANGNSSTDNHEYTYDSDGYPLTQTFVGLNLTFEYNQ